MLSSGWQPLPCAPRYMSSSRWQKAGKSSVGLLDGKHVLRQELPGGQLRQSQIADGSRVDGEIAIRGGGLIVYDALTDQQQVALLRVVALPVDDVDAAALRDQDEFRDILMAVHRARHRGVQRLCAVERREPGHGLACEDGAVLCRDECHGTTFFLQCLFYSLASFCVFLKENRLAA